jgi:hypothetical protein
MHTHHQIKGFCLPRQVFVRATVARIRTRIIKSKASVCRGEYLYAQLRQVFVCATVARIRMRIIRSKAFVSRGTYLYAYQGTE